MATVKENLIAAKALIDTPEKWSKGDWSDNGGCLCALGAANLAATGMFDCVKHDLERALEAALPTGFRTTSGNLRLVPRFNDHRDTTHADIMALFDRAIAAQDGAS